MAAVPVPDPASRRRTAGPAVDGIAGAVPATGEAPAPSRLEQVGPDHFIRTPAA